MKLLKHFTFLTIILLGLFSCESNKWKVDLGDREMDPQWQRFELDLFEQKGEDLSRERLDQLNELYPQLMPLYSQAIMRFGPLK